MTFISYQQLLFDLDTCAQQHLDWYDLRGIVYVPRSGMIPASILACTFNLPLTDLEGFLATGGRFLVRRHHGRLFRHFTQTGPVLILDDSSYSGSTMDWVRNEVDSHVTLRNAQITYYTIYGTSTCWVDCFRVIDGQRIFEWNWKHGNFLREAMIDLDGLLCEDPPPDIGDGEAYAKWISIAPVKHLIRYPVRAIVSARLEKYRGITQDWLDNHGVRADELILFDGSAQDREGKYAQYKANHYSKSKSPLFIESDRHQAKRIHALTGKMTFCPTPPARTYGHDQACSP